MAQADYWLLITVFESSLGRISILICHVELPFVSFYSLKIKGWSLEYMYSLSSKIDAPKIDVFSKNSRNFQNSKIFWWALSKSPISGQFSGNVGKNWHANDWHAKDWRIFKVLRTIKMRQSLVKNCILSIYWVIMVFMVDSDIFYSARMNARSGLGNNKVLK